MLTSTMYGVGWVHVTETSAAGGCVVPNLDGVAEAEHEERAVAETFMDVLLVAAYTGNDIAIRLGKKTDGTDLIIGFILRNATTYDPS